MNIVEGILFVAFIFWLVWYFLEYRGVQGGKWPFNPKTSWSLEELEEELKRNDKQ